MLRLVFLSQKLGDTCEDLGPGNDIYLLSWKCSVFQSSLSCCLCNIHPDMTLWFLISWRTALRSLRFHCSGKDCGLSNKVHFEKNTHGTYPWHCLFSKIHCHVYATCKKANSGSMQVTNILNPAEYFVSGAKHGTFVLWLGNLTSTNSNVCEEQYWLICVQKKKDLIFSTNIWRQFSRISSAQEKLLPLAIHIAKTLILIKWKSPSVH